MAVKIRRLELLLKEIADPYVQENFWRLKQWVEKYLENQELGTSSSGGGGGGTTIINNTNVTNILDNERILLNFTAGQNVGAFKWVYPINATTVMLADNTLNYSTARPIGITLAAATTGSTVQVCCFGKVEDASFGFGNDAQMYLSTSGNATVGIPTLGFNTVVANSLGTGKIFVDIQRPVDLVGLNDNSYHRPLVLDGDRYKVLEQDRFLDSEGQNIHHLLPTEKITVRARRQYLYHEEMTVEGELAIIGEAVGL